VNQTLGSLQLEKHPDKTYIGRVEKGFDFLGYHLTPEGLEVATQTLERFVEHMLLLYEQEPEEPFDSIQLEEYVRRWLRWRYAGF
jgi:RNA-directed DNA polymerase